MLIRDVYPMKVVSRSSNLSPPTVRDVMRKEGLELLTIARRRFLTQEDAEEILRDYRKGVPGRGIKALAKRHDVHPNSVVQLLRTHAEHHQVAGAVREGRSPADDLPEPDGDVPDDSEAPGDS